MNYTTPPDQSPYSKIIKIKSPIKAIVNRVIEENLDKFIVRYGIFELDKLIQEWVDKDESSK